MPIPASSSLRFHRLLLTGAAGALGRELRRRLAPYCDHLRLTDIVELDPPSAGDDAGEEIVRAALEDKAAVRELLRDVDAVVHMGGVSVEAPFEPILAANVIGAFHLYEAARVHGVKRIVFASSNHVTGMYRQDEVIDPLVPVRPDGLYGLSKAWGENLARLYWDRHGIETACLRIGSSFPEPRDRRMLATWLSHADLERLVLACLAAPVVGFSVIYGVSANRTLWWDNTRAGHLGFAPQDSSEPFRATLEARQPVLDLNDPAVRLQGGVFVRTGPLE